MNKRTLNIIVIFITAVGIITLNELGYLDHPDLKKYILIPILTFFYLGQWSTKWIKD